MTHALRALGLFCAILCCCPTYGGGTCCANTSFCTGGFVPGCLCAPSYGARPMCGLGEAP